MIQDSAAFVRILGCKEAGYRSTDHLRYFAHDSSFKTETDRKRSNIVNWCHNVSRYFDFDDETVAMAVTNFDRFLSLRSEVIRNNKNLQLIAMTCLYTAIKINENRVLSPNKFAAMSQGRFKEEDITKMEYEIATALEWRLTPPTPLSFLHAYISTISTDVLPDVKFDSIFTFAKLQVKLSLRHSYFVSVNASCIALAALANSIEKADPGHIDFYEATIQRISRISEIDITAGNFIDIRNALRLLSLPSQATNMDIQIDHTTMRPGQKREPNANNTFPSVSKSPQTTMTFNY
mmetsp:Transcript_4023/g.6292  ORF Transcript_4023/g.6292 Transcript_4023/m.6292 type:complete len:292 (+) Transcript_4023:106-981(+)